MVALKFFALALTICGVLAQKDGEPWRPPGMSKEEYERLRDEEKRVKGQGFSTAQGGEYAQLAVEVVTHFPDSEVFGVKLVNGQPTKAVVGMVNLEQVEISLRVISGQIWSIPGAPGAPKRAQPLANLTMQGYMVKMKPQEEGEAKYQFTTNLVPQNVNLILQAVWQKGNGELVQKTVYNGTVEAVEAPISPFDPQIIFLYFFLALAFGGTCWFIYSTWIAAFFPQKRRGGKGGERAKRSSGGSKKVDPADQVSVIGADGPATTSGAKAYDESWIPAEHLKRPEAKRMGSGRPKSRAA